MNILQKDRVFTYLIHFSHNKFIKIMNLGINCVSKKIYVLLCVISISAPLFASPWIEPTDFHLRSDIQLLSNVGVIKSPITTYPLMWKNIIKELNQHDSEYDSLIVKAALKRIQQAYKQSKNEHLQISIGITNQTTRFQHFGTSVREKGQIQASYENSGELWATKIQVNSYLKPYDNEHIRIDGSYIAFFADNWIISAGYQQQWFGPGWDTALLRSTNAHPLPSLYITRNSSEAFNYPILKLLGPWTLTTGVSNMNDERYTDNTVLWTFRATIKPHANFEFGFSRAAQLCGESPETKKSCDINTWKRMLIGDTNDWSEENPANQLASVDARWGDEFLGFPYSLYWESMGEDAFRPDRFPPFQAKSYLYGTDISYKLSNQTVTTFFEYSETIASCNYSNNCTYEHGTYRTGYRYHGRTLGSTYDNDAKTYTLGFIGIHSDNARKWAVNLRYLELNRDNSNSLNAIYGGGNQIAPLGEDAWNIDFTYQFPLMVGNMELGASYTYSTYAVDDSSKGDTTLWSNWQWAF